MSFTFNTNVPASGNSPSVDQPQMLINNQSTNSLVAVDHISFNTLGGGQHKQVTFNGKNAAGGQIDPASTLFTNSGTASTVAELFYRNQNNTFLVSCLKAFGSFDGSANILGTASNVASVVRNSAGNYTVTLVANAVTGTNYTVLATNTSTSVPKAIVQITITGATTFNYLCAHPISGTTFDTPYNNFIVLQV